MDIPSNTTNSNLIEKLETHYKYQIKIIAVLISILSLFILLTLVSYTPKDEVNTHLSFDEVIALLKGDPLIKSKADTTFNWLGIVGAIISNFLINHTFGYSIILLPLILLIISKDLYFKQRLIPKTIRKIIFVFLFWIIFSSLMGIALNNNFIIVNKEWAGLIGSFLATVITNFLGVFGTSLLLSLLLIILLILGFNLKFKNLTIIADVVIKYFKILITANFSPKGKREEQEKTNSDYISSDTESTELANILKKISEPTLSEETEPIPSDYIHINKPSPNINSALNESSYTEFNKPKTTNDILNNSKTGYQDISDQSQAPKVPVIEKIIIEKYDRGTEPPATQLSAENNELPKNSNNDISKKIQFPNPPEKIELPSKTLNISFEHKPNINDNLSTQPQQQQTTHINKPPLNYQFPPIDLLIQDHEETIVNEEELKLNGRLLQEKLETFKIYIENLTITPGPVVTLYEFIPAPGIKISKIESFTDDMAMALKARGIRIIAPIPGKGTIGIEIPNNKPSLVRFSSVAKSPKFQHSNFSLPLALGKTISGEVFCADLTKMPHLLIAGATGSGKSVGINTIIASLIYKMHPDDLKFVIIDPKKVELNHYSILENHFLAISPDLNSPIITEPQEAVVALKALCAEMEKRYSILASVSQKNIFEYNAKVMAGKFKDETTYEHKKMPYIVLIIDELADLMLTASKEIEGPIIRLAQLARAVGIHCVVATQRPSVDVITGIIKANFPSRIAYLVASKIDSRTILDVSGAEQLIGNGDMLFITAGTPKPIRLQNAFITTEEIEALCDFIAQQPMFDEPYILPSIVEKTKDDETYSKENRDPLFEEAARLVIQTQQASVSLIQRRLKVGFARAGRIMDELEAAGVVGPFDGKTRQVYMESFAELQKIL